MSKNIEEGAVLNPQQHFFKGREWQRPPVLTISSDLQFLPQFPLVGLVQGSSEVVGLQVREMSTGAAVWSREDTSAHL